MTGSVDAAARPGPAGGPAGVHLRAGGTSLLVVRASAAPAGGSPLPQILHWGPALDDPCDADALVLATAAPVLHAAPDRPVRRRLLPMPADGWRLRPGLRGSRADGTAWSPLFAVTAVHHEVRTEGGGFVEVSAGDDAAGLSLRVRLVLHPSGVLECRHWLRNDGAAEYLLGELAGTLPLPGRATEVLDLTGRWCRERVPQRHPLAMGAWTRDGRHGRTGHDAPLVLAVGTAGFGYGTGEVWGVHLGWSGDSTLWAERTSSGEAQLGAGELLAPGEVRLGSGESYAAPPAYAAYSAGGLDGLSTAFHEYVRGRPQHPRSPRKVILNTWEAVYFEHRLDRLTKLADAAANVGVERFVLDDGWFGSRRDDTAGLGDWYVSDEAWPGGLGPLIEHVTSLGMDFGLWVEPEMVNPDSDLFRAHPDWVLHEPGRDPPTWRSQQVLDLSRADVFAYLLERLDALLREHDIAYLKWDHNRDLVDAGHHARPGVRRQTLALYHLLDELRARHPTVEIESCASGGGRVDLGILERTDRVWASDTIDAVDRQQIQLWTQLLLPPELVGSHIGSAVSHTTGRGLSLAFRAATALFGHLGIEWDLTAVSDEDARELAGVVAFYKEVRHLLHHGRVVRVDNPDPTVLVHGVVSADRSEALFAYVQLATSPTEVAPPAQLRGLDPLRRYGVLPVPLAGGPGTQQLDAPPWTRTPLVLTGQALMQVGLAMPVLHPQEALVLRLTRVDGH